MKWYLAIPVPQGGSLYWPLAMWLEGLSKVFAPGYYRDTVEGGPIEHNRNAICHRFLETDADVLWMVDSDMDPRLDDFEQGGAFLMKEAMERDDIDILSGISFRIGGKEQGPTPCVQTLKDRQDVSDRVFARPPGLYEMQGISTGGACIAIKRHVIEKFKEELTPWFLSHFEMENPDRLGVLRLSEDIHFIRESQRLGFRFWIDTRIQWGHLKKMDLRDELVRAKELVARATEDARKPEEVAV